MVESKLRKAMVYSDFIAIYPVAFYSGICSKYIYGARRRDRDEI